MSLLNSSAPLATLLVQVCPWVQGLLSHWVVLWSGRSVCPPSPKVVLDVLPLPLPFLPKHPPRFVSACRRQRAFRRFSCACCLFLLVFFPNALYCGYQYKNGGLQLLNPIPAPRAPSPLQSRSLALLSSSFLFPSESVDERLPLAALRDWSKRSWDPYVPAAPTNAQWIQTSQINFISPAASGPLVPHLSGQAGLFASSPRQALVPLSQKVAPDPPYAFCSSSEWGSLGQAMASNGMLVPVLDHLIPVF